MFIISVILSFTMDKVYYRNWSYYSDICKQIEKQPDDKANYISFGSSHGQEGLNYSHNRGLNLGFPNQSFYFDYRLLKKYYHHLDEDGTIILPVSLFSFYSGTQILEETKSNYFGLLKPSDNYNTSTADVIFSGTQRFFTLKFYKNLIKHSQLEQTSTNHPINIDNWKSESIHTAKTQLGEVGCFSRDIEELSVEPFLEIISFAREKRLKVVLITTPKTELYLSNIKDINPNAHEERIYSNISNCERVIGSKISFLDYSHDVRFRNRYEYFRDDDHLNEKGAELFTSILIQDLKTTGNEVRNSSVF